jgi:hypothetical protein
MPRPRYAPAGSRPPPRPLAPGPGPWPRAAGRAPSAPPCRLQTPASAARGPSRRAVRGPSRRAVRGHVHTRGPGGRSSPARTGPAPARTGSAAHPRTHSRADPRKCVTKLSTNYQRRPIRAAKGTSPSLRPPHSLPPPHSFLAPTSFLAPHLAPLVPPCPAPPVPPCPAPLAPASPRAPCPALPRAPCPAYPAPHCPGRLSAASIRVRGGWCPWCARLPAGTTAMSHCRGQGNSDATSRWLPGRRWAPGLGPGRHQWQVTPAAQGTRLRNPRREGHVHRRSGHIPPAMSSRMNMVQQTAHNSL